MVKIAGTIIAVCLIWGYLWVSIKIGLEYVPPFFLSAARFLAGGLALLVFQAARKKRLMPNGKREWMHLLTLSALMCVGFSALSTFGMQYLDSGLTSMLVYTMPMIVNILAPFILKERMTRKKFAGLIVSTAGLLLIMGPQMFRLTWSLSMFGEFVVLTSAFFWACSNLYAKKFFFDYDKILMTLWQLLLGGTMLLIISLLTESVSFARWNLIPIISVLYNGILATAIAFAAWNWILSRIEASIASISIMSVPILGLFFGWLQLGEKITEHILIGAGLVCMGIALNSIKFKKAR